MSPIASFHSRRRAHDLEKRQHLFSHHILAPLPPNKVGVFGCGSPMDITPEVVKAEKEIEGQWSSRPAFQPADSVDDYSRPLADYPDTPPSYEEVAAAGVGAGAKPVVPVVPGSLNAFAASSSGVPAGGATRRVPPALPPRHDKAPGAF